VNNGLILILELKKDSYRGDEPIVATLILQNVGTNRILANNRMWPVARLGSDEIFDVSFMIIDPDGIKHDYNIMAQLVRTTDDDFVKLYPSQGILSEFYEIHDLFDPVIALKGKYVLQAYYANQMDPSDGRTAWKGALESNIVEFFYTP
jgi:hypothetical protein